MIKNVHCQTSVYSILYLGMVASFDELAKQLAKQYILRYLSWIDAKVTLEDTN